MSRYWSCFGGRYRMGRLLGCGGRGAVYECFDETTERTRAIKVMHAHKLDGAAARARFQREAWIGGGADSPHLVDLVDAGLDDGVPFLVMELLSGEDLGSRLVRNGARPAEEVIDHLGQVAQALAGLHARGVIHRDLKPSNLFLHEVPGQLPCIKVLDLGVAEVLSELAPSATARVGTVLYLAPEQVRGRPVTEATDVHALAHIAYTLLAGASYWHDDRELDPIALASRVAGGPIEPASVRALARGVMLPGGFDAWFAIATAAEPSGRFPSAAAAVRALAAALGASAAGAQRSSSPVQ